VTSRAPGHALIQLRQARDHADRHFADPLTLEDLASVAALSKYHFHRIFTVTYGRTPAAHLTERRIERAQDLLRSTNLSVTEVCFAVGYNSLGSFSSRFTQIVGETPSEFQHRYGASDPGLLSLHERIPRAKIATWEKRLSGAQSYHANMITNVSLVSVSGH
jgi:AraC-like DNA-binding protein